MSSLATVFCGYLRTTIRCFYLTFDASNSANFIWRNMLYIRVLTLYFLSFEGGPRVKNGLGLPTNRFVGTTGHDAGAATKHRAIS